MLRQSPAARLPGGDRRDASDPRAHQRQQRRLADGQLQIDGVHLFLCPIGPPDEARLPGLLARLDAAERARAARFVFLRDRWSYAAAHALLRHALDQADGPAAWRFAADARGKPRLDPPRPGLHFNLSHAEALVAVALSGQAVGVDVEPADRPLDVAAIGEMVLAPAERAGCDRARLLQLWVAKEAVAKAVGLGLSLPFARIVFHGDPPVLRELPAEHGPAEGWWVHGLRHAGHLVAVAAARPPSALRVIPTALPALLR